MTSAGSRDVDEPDKNVSTIGQKKFGTGIRDPQKNPTDCDDPQPSP